MISKPPKDPIHAIRKKLLGMTQIQFATLTGVAQATVSRWESGALEPTRAEMRTIRNAVLASGQHWNDAWFFDPVEQVAIEDVE